tara:strand:+ start:980 stop:1282 length:303 start_codon:yes stop_codon:yes gene_type:complete
MSSIKSLTPESEIQIIERYVKSAYLHSRGTSCYPECLLKDISKKLYDNLFEWRGSRQERPLDRPVKYNLIDIFNELKFGRTSEDQKFLKKCVKKLTHSKK